MAKAKTYFEQVPVEVVTKNPDVEVRVNHGTAKQSGASKRKKPHARAAAKTIAERRDGKS